MKVVFPALVFYVNKYINTIDMCSGLKYNKKMIEKVFDGYIFHINHS